MKVQDLDYATVGDETRAVANLQDPEILKKNYPKGFKTVKPYLRLTPAPNKLPTSPRIQAPAARKSRSYDPSKQDERRAGVPRVGCRRVCGSGGGVGAAAEEAHGEVLRSVGAKVAVKAGVERGGEECQVDERAEVGGEAGAPERVARVSTGCGAVPGPGILRLEGVRRGKSSPRPRGGGSYFGGEAIGDRALRGHLDSSGASVTRRLHPGDYFFLRSTARRSPSSARNAKYRR